MRKYEHSHQAERLERWYTKITTPKPVKPVKEKKASFDYGPVKAARRERTAQNYLIRADKKLKKLNAYKRWTHWVARSLEEYNTMHSLTN